MIRGHVVRDGVDFPIVNVTFEAARLIIHAHRSNPVSWPLTGPITVFGQDGVGVCQFDQEPDWPAYAETVAQPLRITKANFDPGVCPACGRSSEPIPSFGEAL